MAKVQYTLKERKWLKGYVVYVRFPRPGGILDLKSRWSQWFKADQDELADLMARLSREPEDN